MNLFERRAVHTPCIENIKHAADISARSVAQVSIRDFEYYIRIKKYNLAQERLDFISITDGGWR